MCMYNNNMDSNTNGGVTTICNLILATILNDEYKALRNVRKIQDLDKFNRLRMWISVCLSADYDAFQMVT